MLSAPHPSHTVVPLSFSLFFLTVINFLPIVPPVFSTPLQSPIETDTGQEPGFEGVLKQALEHLVVSISPEDFQDEIELIQVSYNNLDGVPTTTYVLEDYSNTRHTPIFKRVGRNDSGVPVVILSQNEDHLLKRHQDENGKKKQVFVVLKQMNVSEPDVYRPFYVYVRDVPQSPDTTNGGIILELGSSGNKISVEFDGWENRGVSKNVAHALGWTSCFVSVLPSCKFEVPEEFMNDEILPSVQDAEQREANQENNVNKGIKDMNGGSPSYYDLFADLDENVERLLYVKKMVGIYVYTLSAATAAASKEAIHLAGMQPTVATPQTFDEVATTKLSDMKRAVELFQQTVGETDPEVMEFLVPSDSEIVENSIIILNQTETTTPTPIAALAPMPIMNETSHFTVLKEEYKMLIDRLESLSKIYPNIDNSTPKLLPLPPSDEDPPALQLNALKAQTLFHYRRINPIGLKMAEHILQQSEVGQELRMNPVEEQKLLENEVYVLAHPPQVLQGGIIKGSMLGLYLGVNGLIRGDLVHFGDSELKYKEESFLDIKRRFEGKATSSRWSDDKFGKILKGIVNSQNGQDFLRTAAGTLMAADGNAEVIEGMVASLTGSDGPAETAIKVKNLIRALLGGTIALAFNEAGHFIKSGDYRDVAKTALKSLKDADVSLVNDVAVPIIDQALSGNNEVVLNSLKNMVEDPKRIMQLGVKKIPIVGPPLFLVTGFFRRAMQNGDPSTTGYRVDTSLFGNIGWRTADINCEHLASHSLTIENRVGPFIGYGNCQLKPLKVSEFQGLTTVEDISEVYNTLVRNQCSDRHRILIEQLLDDNEENPNQKKLLIYDGKTGILSLNNTHPLLKKPKLIQIELTQLSAAFELASLSHTVIGQWMLSDLYEETPSGSSRITQTVKTLVYSTLHSIKEARSKVPTHLVKLMRNAVKTLKTSLTKMLQDYDRFKACSQCGQEIIEVAENDIFELFSASNFIIHGLRNLDTTNGNEDVRTVYKKFVQNNREGLERGIQILL